MTSKARTFHLHYNRFGAKRLAKDVWTIHLTTGCIHCRKVDLQVPVETIYRGDTAPQPRAYLKGRGFVRKKRGGVVEITST